MFNCTPNWKGLRSHPLTKMNECTFCHSPVFSWYILVPLWLWSPMYSVYGGPFLPQKLGSIVPSRESSLDSTHSKPRKQSQFPTNHLPIKYIPRYWGSSPVHFWRCRCSHLCKQPLSWPPWWTFQPPPPLTNDSTSLPESTCTPRQRAPERRWRWVQLLTSPCANG